MLDIEDVRPLLEHDRLRPALKVCGSLHRFAACLFEIRQSKWRKAAAKPVAVRNALSGKANPIEPLDGQAERLGR
jgi:hypothetical protein